MINVAFPVCEPYSKLTFQPALYVAKAQKKHSEGFGVFEDKNVFSRVNYVVLHADGLS